MSTQTHLDALYKMVVSLRRKVALLSGLVASGELTGDVTAGPGSGPQVTTLANSGVTAGTYGDATNVPQVTVDAKGRVTTAINVPIVLGGAGDVVGPAGATDGNIATFDGTTGKLIKDGGGTILDVLAVAASDAATNQPNVTLAGTPDYLTLAGQVITLGQIDLATDVTGLLPNATLADMAQATIKGRAAGAGTGVPVDLTATQATVILEAVVGDSGAGGVKGLVPAPAAGDAAAGKYLGADGTFSVPVGSGLSSWVPLSAGVEPLAFISDGAGLPILVAYP